MFSRKTKIVCSMGPTTADVQIVVDLLNAGMNVARFNFSHGDHESHRQAMERVRKASALTGIPVALMLDTKGPEIRTGLVPDDGKITIHTGDTVIITADGSPVLPVTGSEPARISVSWKDLPQRVSPGIRILIADGLVELDVVKTDGVTVTCTAKNTGSFGSRKNVNLIGIHPGLPIMSEQDKDDIAFGVEMGMDFIAASFVSFASEVVEIRKYLESLNSKMRIIAKIENEEGLDNIKEIIAAADGVMVARGDMGVQLPTERIPLAQKYIIRQCHAAGKPVITATQMLESMIVNPRPTRAELTDVANAIFDGTDAVMLSGETANGAWPVEAVQTMARIAVTVEDSEEYCRLMRDMQKEEPSAGSIAQIMARMAYLTATDIRAIAILTPTLTGNTARMLSAFRPEQSILAVTPNEHVQRQLLLNWGVVPLLTKVAQDSEEMVQNAIKIALDTKAVSLSDRIVIVAGVPIASPIMVNTVRVLLVGNVLARGARGSGGRSGTRATGRIVRAENPEDAFMALKKKGGEILVCPSLNMNYAPIMRVVDGIIVEGDIEIPEDSIPLINPCLVWVSHVSAAMKTFESGLTVTVDGSEQLEYEGSI